MILMELKIKYEIDLLKPNSLDFNELYNLNDV